MSVVRQLGILAAVGILAAAILMSGLISFGRETAGPGGSGRDRGADGPAPVIVEPVRFASNAAVVEAVGTGEAVKSVTLFPEAAGRVTEILFSAGEAVERGDVLLRLDDDEEKLALELAHVHLKDARQQLARYEQVAPSGAVSTSEVDRARTALSAARIEIAQAELALRNRTLVAPFAGIVGISDVDVGDRITDSTPVTTLDDRSILLVDFEVPEAFAYGVRKGGEITATTWALPDQTFAGAVNSLDSRIDRETRTLRVRARIPNEDDQLRPGMSFVIRLPLQGERYPSVPSIAVQWDREGAYVWRVVEGTSERVAVQVLKREDDWVLIDAPLAADDRIVVEGVQRLRPGRAVRIETPDTLAGREPARGA